MKRFIPKFIKRIISRIKVYRILHNGHTIGRYDMNKKSIITDENGNVAVWRDRSGNKNHLQASPMPIIKEVIIRSGEDSEDTQDLIYEYLRRKWMPNWWEKIMDWIKKMISNFKAALKELNL